MTAGVQIGLFKFSYNVIKIYSTCKRCVEISFIHPQYSLLDG